MSAPNQKLHTTIENFDFNRADVPFFRQYVWNDYTEGQRAILDVVRQNIADLIMDRALSVDYKVNSTEDPVEKFTVHAGDAKNILVVAVSREPNPVYLNPACFEIRDLYNLLAEYESNNKAHSFGDVGVGVVNVVHRLRTMMTSLQGIAFGNIQVTQDGMSFYIQERYVLGFNIVIRLKNGTYRTVGS